LGIEKLAAGKDWTRRRAQSGGAFFTLGVHALDLARWLAGARGEPLQNLMAFSNHEDDASADFPLFSTLSGSLPNGIQLLAGADLRGDAPFMLDLKIEAKEGGSYPDPSLPSPYPEEAGAADVEYEGLIGDFLEAASVGKPNPDEVHEYLESHRELIQAQQLIAPE
jgi:predicted dehydrogenase